jgi:phosphoglycolate phosphatase
MRYRLLLWDFDGTLADTLADSVRTYNGLAGKYGFRLIEDVPAAQRLSTWAFVREYGVSLTRFPAFKREYLALLHQHMASTRLFPGLAEMLRSSHREGIRHGILSSNRKENILACLRANQVAELFEFTVSYVRLLGKARAIRRIAATRVQVAGELLCVGDECRDVEAARQAGVDVAAVTWGFHNEQVLIEGSPTYLIRQPSELLDLVISDASRLRR